MGESQCLHFLSEIICGSCRHGFLQLIYKFCVFGNKSSGRSFRHQKPLSFKFVEGPLHCIGIDLKVPGQLTYGRYSLGR